MLRLLLEQQKKDIKRDYQTRFVVVLLLLVLAVVFFWIISLVPSFVLIYFEERAIKESSSEILEDSLLEDGTPVDEYVRDINNKIKLLNTPEFPVTKLIGEVVSRQVRSVSINTFEFKSEENKGTIFVSGIANNRESLVDFSNSLQESELFESIDVPFSNFAKSTDIPFTLTINLKEIQP